MAIDRLNPAAALLSALRAEMAPKSERLGPADRHRSGTGKAHVRDPEALRRDLRAIAQSVTAADPAAARDAQVRLVRAILQWELGPEVREHPDWQAMVDAVSDTLQAKDDWNAQFEKLLVQLRS